MTRALNSYRCYVCGAPAEDPPWGHDGRTPSFDICPCCGCEHGYEDSTLAGIERLRAAWLAAGGHWREPGFKPADFNLQQQLSQIPDGSSARQSLARPADDAADAGNGGEA